MYVYAALFFALLACTRSDDPATDESGGDTAAEDTGAEDTGEVTGDGTELVLIGYLGEATVDATSWTGTEALRAVSADEGVERCRFEWTTTGSPHPQAAACDGCTFAHEVALSDGHVVGPSCDWLFDTNGPPPADGGSFPYAYHPDHEGSGPALLYYYVDRWIPLPNEVAYDTATGGLTYTVEVGEDYF